MCGSQKNERERERAKREKEKRNLERGRGRQKGRERVEEKREWGAATPQMPLVFSGIPQP